LKFTKLKAVGIVAGVAALAFITTPASAGSSAITDVSGVDNDAACQIGNPTNVTAPAPNYIPSPGAPGGSLGVPAGGDGCDGISTYGDSAETVDLRNVDLSFTGGKLTAAFTVDGTIPGGTASLATADLPDASYVAFSYRALYQNSTRQTNVPYVAATRLTGGAIYGLNEHWQDGFHKFVAFEVVYLGDHWLHSASIGTLDSGPDGAFYFDELGVSHDGGATWSTDDPCMPHGTTWSVAYTGTNKVSVTVDGIAKFSNIQAVGNCINDEYVVAGDSILNIKGLATADSTVTLPITIPLSLIPGFSDITSVGGFLATVDYTDGNSRNVGLVGTALQPNRVGLPWSGGFIGLVDTLGDGPRCWTSTLGGVLPSNPLWVANQPCYIDDDVVPGPSGNIDPGLGRGSILEEWWDTAYGFTA